MDASPIFGKISGPSFPPGPLSLWGNEKEKEKRMWDQGEGKKGKMTPETSIDIIFYETSVFSHASSVRQRTYVVGKPFKASPASRGSPLAGWRVAATVPTANSDYLWPSFFRRANQ